MPNGAMATAAAATPAVPRVLRVAAAHRPPFMFYDPVSMSLTRCSLNSFCVVEETDRVFTRMHRVQAENTHLTHYSCIEACLHACTAMLVCHIQ